MTGGEAWNDKGKKLSFWGAAFPLSVILRGGFPHSVILRSFAPKNLWDAALSGEKRFFAPLRMTVGEAWNDNGGAARNDGRDRMTGETG